jgi:hypothetical protein
VLILFSHNRSANPKIVNSPLLFQKLPATKYPSTNYKKIERGKTHFFRWVFPPAVQVFLPVICH